ncbi:MAG: nuclease A inhibitor family protein [Archangium sp.]|nr:nuclease A inhibitor family protein [Archangium sp.]MDP3156548.1 nuclease A inhibitor family protein [Archangium sp.]MDP3573891.1 nuclease A inhibitor family protein [Archangium sp.]
MARIPTTPSPRVFAETWSTDFKEAVKKAAGKDGRLTMSEATKLAARPDADKVFADNAINYLKATGKQSVSVEVLATSAKAYALRAAEVAAGNDGKLSLADGAKLPNDLKEDFFMLRGKTVPGTTPAPASALSEVKAKLEAATDGLWMPSETDAKFKFLTGTQLNGAPITADLVRAQFSAQHDAAIADLMWMDPSQIPLSTHTNVEERNANDFLNRLAIDHDPSDPESTARAARFAALKRTIDSQLTDVKVFRFGDNSLSTFIVGRTRTGELAGLLTGQVET